ncbi:putative solute carrier organic anion transporter family member 4C1 [Apostichopus japonicus]|uniref:Putative solute carrier organic anion transporter family member 4C1 n=2 Tax=Stichopus japonicus TaxID=307972 RepID=A0A2G8LAK2_STIJA|nr:putative solute carrier organic anion transporter family member 4C1 [Apostichopus japonicus]
MGVQSLMYRALGTVPGPIIFGSLIDRACLIWEYSDCDDDGGVCWLYDNDDFGGYAFKILFSCRFVTICFFVLAYVFYKPISEIDPEQGQETPFEDGAQSNADLPSNLEVNDSVIIKSYKVRSD